VHATVRERKRERNTWGRAERRVKRESAERRGRGYSKRAAVLSAPIDYGAGKSRGTSR